MAYNKQAARLNRCPRYQGGILAGGAILSAFTDAPINDFDIYFSSEEDFALAICDAYEDNFWCVSVTDRAVTFADGDLVIQFMRFGWFKTPGEIFEAFDFTCCMGAYILDDKGKPSPDRFYLHDDFLPAAAEKRLTFNAGTHFPVASAMRVVKYMDRGYKIDRPNMLAIALACAGVKLDSWEALKKQIGGIYGNRISIATDGDFSIKASISAVQNEEVSTQIHFDDEIDEITYSSAEKLLEYLNIKMPEEYA